MEMEREHRRVNVNGVMLRCEVSWSRDMAADRATEELFVFHHGHQASLETFQEVCAIVASRRLARCLNVNCRGAMGSGGGSGDDDLEEYTIEQLASDTLVLVDKVFGEGKRFHFVGHSMAGQVGYLLAHKHPERVISMVLLAPAAITGLGRTITEEFIKQDFEEWANAQRNEKAYNELLQRTLKMTGRTEQDDETLRRNTKKYVDINLRCTKGHCIGLWRSMRDFYVDPGSIKTPVLIMAGAADSVLNYNLIDFQNLRRTATLCVLPRVSHGLPRDLPKTVADAILDFVDHGVVSFFTLREKIPKL